jgi:uncharacterized protein YndB with AHSA1/START domain
VRGEPADLGGHIGLHGGDGVVVVGLDAHDARGLGGAKADREHGPERDRHLAEDVARMALPENPLDAVDEPARLDETLDHGEQGSLGAFVSGVLARDEADVGSHAGELLPLGLVERGEGLDACDLLRGHHETTNLPAGGWAYGTKALFLELKRVLPAPAERVFRAFSAAGGLAAWWGPAGFTTRSLEFDPEVGAPYRIEMQPPEGDAFYLTGEFRDVEPPDRLAFTFAWEEPDPDDVENLVELTFRGLGDATEVGLTQGPFKTEARWELHRDGWTDSFDKLESFLARA